MGNQVWAPTVPVHDSHKLGNNSFMLLSLWCCCCCFRSWSATAEHGTVVMATVRISCILPLLLPVLSMADVDSYGAPVGRPVYSPQPQQYSAPVQTYQGTANVQLPNHDYYKHEHHHYYHAGPPKVVQVQVPVTQKPYVVQVPQNVPVQFVPVNVPTQPPPPVQVVQVQPQVGYSQPQHIHHYPIDNQCHDFD